MAEEVRAAGAVLWRDDGNGRRLVAVIHRPKYDDWSLPKGKLDRGEDDREAAVREIREETAARAEIVGDLGEVSYPIRRRGRRADKVVRYFEMRVTGDGEFVPNAEVDDLRWLPVEDAESMLTYDRDRDVLRRYRSRGPQMQGPGDDEDG